MSLTLTCEISKPSDVQGVDDDRLGPLTLTIDKGTDAARYPWTLAEDVWWTPAIPSGKTPWFWAVFVTGDNSVDVGFGQGQPIRLEAAGIPGIWTGDQIPSMRPVGGASKVIVWIVFV